MTEFQAFILGVIQGITEFLPVSSSGHLELGTRFLGIKNADNLLFAVNVHAATVLSTLIVFRRNISELFSGILNKGWNENKSYLLKLLISAVPVILIGLFFADRIESLFHQNILLVGIMLIFTALLLIFANFSVSGEGKISYLHSFIIGISQAIAVLPGISRSGATIATGLILKNSRKMMAQFSFLMVLLPIIGAFGWEFAKGSFTGSETIGFLPMAIGFITSFITGLVACRFMVKIVSNGKLIYFGIYCFIAGLFAIFAA